MAGEVGLGRVHAKVSFPSAYSAAFVAHEAKVLHSLPLDDDDDDAEENIVIVIVIVIASPCSSSAASGAAGSAEAGCKGFTPAAALSVRHAPRRC
eukprot:3466803-Pyramimonas_sp.AAC.1